MMRPPASVPCRRSPCAGRARPTRSLTTVAWLALDATYTTGEVLAVDGGRAIATADI